MTAKKCTKTLRVQSHCCFANLNLLLFAVLVKVAVVVAQAPYIFYMTVTVIGIDYERYVLDS